MIYYITWKLHVDDDHLQLVELHRHLLDGLELDVRVGAAQVEDLQVGAGPSDDGVDLILPAGSGDADGGNLRKKSVAECLLEKGDFLARQELQVKRVETPHLVQALYSKIMGHVL